MPSKLLLFFSLFFCSTTFGQYDGKGDQEASRFRPGAGWFFTGMRPAEKQKVRKYDRLVFDITYNDWIGDRVPFQNEPLSIGFAVNCLFDRPLTVGNTVSLGYGLAYKRNRFQYNGFLSEQKGNPQSTTILYGPSSSTQTMIYNQVSIPLELRFRKESWKHLKVHLGGSIGFGYRFHTKTVNQTSDGKIVVKNYQNRGFDPLRFSSHIRFGFRNWALFASYDFKPLFANTQSIQLNPLQVGISISLF